VRLEQRCDLVTSKIDEPSVVCIANPSLAPLHTHRQLHYGGRNLDVTSLGNPRKLFADTYRISDVFKSMTTNYEVEKLVLVRKGLRAADVVNSPVFFGDRIITEKVLPCSVRLIVREQIDHMRGASRSLACSTHIEDSRPTRKPGLNLALNVFVHCSLLQISADRGLPVSADQ